MNRAINVWTDGACEPNPGVGGWGYVIRIGTDAAESFGGEPHTTNNLWLLLEAQLLRVQGTRLCWVRGHSGNPGNERADALAAAGRAGVILFGEVAA